MPPATTIWADPALIRSWATIAACMPEPHILLRVVACTCSGRPAPMAAWRAGAWPRPADSTLPMMIWSIACGSTPARSTAALTAVDPSWVAFTVERAPWKLPIGVRA